MPYTLTQLNVGQLTANDTVATVDGVPVSTSTVISTGTVINLVPRAISQFKTVRATMDWGGSVVNGVIAPDKLSATWTAKGEYEQGSFTVTVENRPKPPKPDGYKATQADIDKLASDGLVLSVDGVNVVAGAVYKAGVWKVTALPTWKIRSFKMSFMTEDVEFVNYTFVVASDKLSASYTVIQVPQTEGSLPYTADTEQETPAVMASFNEVYHVTAEIMENVNKQRFRLEDSGDAESPSIETVDYGKNILSLISIPFQIDPAYTLQEEAVKLGNITISQRAPKLSSDTIQIDLGSITVPAADSSLDYIGVDALLYLPYSNPVSLDLEYVLGATVKVSYLVDVYSGKCTVQIDSSAVDGVLETSSVNMGWNIPFMNIVNRDADNQGAALGGDNGILQARIDLVKADKILANGFFTIPALDEGVLSAAKGYIEVDNVELKTTATGKERGMIENLLTNGVIINA